MCNMATAFQMGGTLLSAYGANKAAKAKAADEISAGNAEAVVIRRAGENQRGAARTAFAGSGVKLDSGTTALVEQDIRAGYEQDAMVAEVGGQRRGAMVRAQAHSAAAGSALSAAGSMASGWRGVHSQRAPQRTNDISGVNGSNAYEMWLRNGVGGD